MVYRIFENFYRNYGTFKDLRVIQNWLFFPSTKIDVVFDMKMQLITVRVTQSGDRQKSHILSRTWFWHIFVKSIKVFREKITLAED